ncbi:copper resistance CopC family protein [Micromonospora sp. WMMA1923]|uniref:copper resistance CopC family protein n=1 Tax=Micromonospora sp. WMMA1923 TaxID=3404125 RepID=UPI003B94B304
MRTRIVLALSGVVVVLLGTPTPAWAHNSLRAATPAQNATLTTAPTQITLDFQQRIDPAFTTIVVTDASSRRIAATDPVVTGATGTARLTETLPNGSYLVAYRVVSADGHPVQGSYPFTVADPTAPQVAPPTPAPAAAAPDDRRRTWLAVAAGTLATLAGLVVVTLIGRRRRARPAR